MQQIAASDLHVYMIPPIDVWNGWRPIRKVMRQSVSEYTDDVRWWTDRLEGAQERVRAAGFDAHPTGWMVTSIPAADGSNFCEAILAVKGHAGWTYVVSPYALPWLESMNQLSDQP